MEPIHIISLGLVLFIVIGIIALQFYFFGKNLKRMKEFGSIFDDEGSWGISQDSEKNLVYGIRGNGNKVFVDIKESINKYLSNAVGGVVDYQLLKDSIDRHCDSIEEDISSQTPVPLYCGLAGTMAGVILGLGAMLFSGAIKDLLSGEDMQSLSSATDGVNDLLFGVALAMIASICGIILTTTNSLLFKKYKLNQESGKNSFLAWMQSRLLPALPTDTAEALNNLVKNLNRFNETFRENTAHLGSSLSQVNESYRIQADIIQAVHDMDVMKMARANVRVLQELKECTDKLEQFNEYLSEVQGYTKTIQTFNEQFAKDAERFHVLEELAEYYRKHKASIASTMASADDALRTALLEVKEGSTIGVKELVSALTIQNEAFKDMIKQQQEDFDLLSKNMKASFDAQMSSMPHVAKQLAALQDLPKQLEKLADKIEAANKASSRSIVDGVDAKLKKAVANSMLTGGGNNSNGDNIHVNVLPNWMKAGIMLLLLLITIFVGINTWHNCFSGNEDEQSNVSDSLVTDSIAQGPDSLVNMQQNVSNQVVPVVPENPHNN